MRDDDRPPKDALPLAEAFEKLLPEWERRRFAQQQRAALEDPDDPSAEYFSGPYRPPQSDEDSFYGAATSGMVLTWGREGTIGGGWTSIPPPLWPGLVIVNVALGYVSNEDPNYAPIEFWRVRVKLADALLPGSPRGRPRARGDDALVSAARAIRAENLSLSERDAARVVTARIADPGERGNAIRRVIRKIRN